MLKTIICILMFVGGAYYSFKSIIYLISAFYDKATDVVVDTINKQGLRNWVKVESIDRFVRNFVVAYFLFFIGFCLYKII